MSAASVAVRGVLLLAAAAATTNPAATTLLVFALICVLARYLETCHARRG